MITKNIPKLNLFNLKEIILAFSRNLFPAVVAICHCELVNQSLNDRIFTPIRATNKSFELFESSQN